QHVVRELEVHPIGIERLEGVLDAAEGLVGQPKVGRLVHAHLLTRAGRTCTLQFVRVPCKTTTCPARPPRGSASRCARPSGGSAPPPRRGCTPSPTPSVSRTWGSSPRACCGGTGSSRTATVARRRWRAKAWSASSRTSRRAR